MEKKIKAILACREKACIDQPGLVRAAVLIPLFKKNGEYHVLLTRRTDKVRHHKGQISFPGGRQDQGEDLLATALREAKEEMGIEEKDVHILGELDDMCTVASDFCISPFVGLIPYPYPFKISRHEIEEIIEVPLSVFLDETKFREELRSRDGEPVLVYFYQHDEHTIWGATARILKQLMDLISSEEKKGSKSI
ncbi:MAG: CoA pyrophosphatase [Deltaproteobacteria bacterium]|jgi:8-oxo-dGTP pyrophosphatase MutT (NUDIX family)|nr:CoA pyrophosphatase [Deltaproteobacteria bacterium]